VDGEQVGGRQGYILRHSYRPDWMKNYPDSNCWKLGCNEILHLVDWYISFLTDCWSVKKQKVEITASPERQRNK